MFKRRIRPLAVLAMMVAGGIAWAGNTVEGSIEAFLIKTDLDGKEVLETATQAAPGQIMEYRLTFTNHGETAVRGLKVVDPIPTHTTFIGASNFTDAAAVFEVSIDGGKTFETEPVVRYEKQPDGELKQIIIPPERYTHLRWNVEDVLGASGARQQYSYRVLVN